MKLAEIENAMNTEGFSEELHSQFQNKCKYLRSNACLPPPEGR